MSTSRRSILEVVTKAFSLELTKEDYERPHVTVTNKFRTPSDLLDSTSSSRGELFPWFNIALGIHSAALDLSGSMEVDRSVPVIVVAYDVSEDTEGADDLQLVLASLSDTVVKVVTGAHKEFCAAGFGVTEIQLFPSEDEEQYDIAVLTARIITVGGD